MMMESGKLWRQYIIAAIANLSIAVIGFCMGWTSPINIKLEDVAQSPLPETLTSDQLAWVGSILTIGAIFGPFIAGLLTANIGRKWGLLSVAVPLCIGWILVGAATDVVMIYAGRVFWGLALGMTFTICPMYCAEIATDEQRGAIGSFLQGFLMIGYLLVYSVGPYVSYSIVSYVGVSTVAVFTIAFYFMPESPIYYLIKNDRESAAESLAVIRGKSLTGVKSELETMAHDVETSMKRTATVLDVFRGSNFKAFYLSCGLLFFQQFSGIMPVSFYLTTIFAASGTGLDPPIATIIIGAVQVLASFMTPFVVDRLGRRILLMISSCGTAIGLIVLGTFFVLDSNDSPTVDSLSFLPVVSLVLFVCSFSWGLGPLPWAVMSELFPIEVKAIAAPIATAFCWSAAFLVARYFTSVADTLGMGGVFFIFGGCCVGSFFFTLFLVPETKGKSFQEIQEMLAANIAIASTGYCMGWTSPINVKLDNVTTSPLPKPLTEDEGAWVGSFLTVGAIFGPFVGGFAGAKIGRKWGLLSSAIPLLAGWILVAVANNVGMIYAGRLCWGLAVGMLFTISPMYCAEIATDDCRGALGSFLQGFIVVGYLVVYAVGPYVSYGAVAYLGAAFVVVFCITFYFMPESPIYYLSKNDRESAGKCLAIIRGKSLVGVQVELEKMAADVEASMRRTATLMDVFRGGNFKAFYISCALVCFQQFSGITAVLFYLTTIFDAANTGLNSSIATIIIGIVQIVASFMTPLVVDRLGRRILLMISACGTAVGLGLLGMFFALQSKGSPVVSSIGFLPVLSLVLFITTYCWGLGPLPWAVMSELFPIEVKAIAAPIATAVCWIAAFIVARFFSAVVNAVGRSVAFFLFGGCCVIAFLFILFLVPETKGKSFQEIQEMLSGKTNEKA